MPVRSVLFFWFALASAAGPVCANPPGDLLGGEISVSAAYAEPSPALGGLEFSAAQYPNADFLVAWSGGNDALFGGVVARRFSRSGAALGPELQLNSSIEADQYTAPRIAVGQKWHGAAVWSGRLADRRLRLYLRRLFGDSRPRGRDIVIADSLCPHDATVAVSAEGYVAVAWIGYEGEAYDCFFDARSVYFKVFNPDGVLLTPIPIPVVAVPVSTDPFVMGDHAPPAGLAFGPKLVWDRGTGFLLAWETATAHFGPTLHHAAHVRRIQQSGGLVGGTYLIDVSSGFDFMMPAMAPVVTAFHNSEFAVAWVSDLGAKLQRYTASAQPKGPSFAPSHGVTRLISDIPRNLILMTSGPDIQLLSRNNAPLISPIDVPQQSVIASGYGDVVNVYQRRATGQTALFAQRYAGPTGGTP